MKVYILKHYIDHEGFSIELVTTNKAKADKLAEDYNNSPGCGLNQLYWADVDTYNVDE